MGINRVRSFQVTYQVELHEFKPVDPEEARSFEERNTVGTRKKERGNYWFKRNEFNLAIQLYRKAIEYFDENVDSADAPPPSSTQVSELQWQVEMHTDPQLFLLYSHLPAKRSKSFWNNG